MFDLFLIKFQFFFLAMSVIPKFEDAIQRKNFFKSCVLKDTLDDILIVLQTDPVYDQILPNFNEQVFLIEELFSWTSLFWCALEQLGTSKAIEFLAWFKKARKILLKQQKFHFLWAIRASLDNIVDSESVAAEIKNFIFVNFR